MAAWSPLLFVITSFCVTLTSLSVRLLPSSKFLACVRAAGKSAKHCHDKKYGCEERERETAKLAAC